MKTERKYKPIKESRDWYFIEYHPPKYGEKFAILQLVITKNATKNEIASAMEKELENWLNRYPIPLMVSAFDNKGDLYNLGEVKTCNHLIGFFDQNSKICLHWRLLKDEEIPEIALNQEYVDNLYSNWVFSAYAELDAERRKKRQQIKTGWVVFFIWLVVIPALIAIFEYSSNLLSLVAFNLQLI